MDRFDRFQMLHRLFRSHRYPIALATLAEKLECSPKTVRRTIESMQLYLDAPIEYFAEQNGWHYANKDQDLFELPGLWLTSYELQSLTLLLQLLSNFGNGLLNQELGIIERQVNQLLSARGINRSAFEQHIKIMALNHRYVPNHVFAQLCEAVLKHRVPRPSRARG